MYYNILSEDELTVEVIRYDDYPNYIEGDLVIPNKIVYNSTTYTVTVIGDDAFVGCYGLTSVTIPNSVTTIGDDAFVGCSGLTSVTIPNSVTKIGYSAFHGCERLTSVTIPNSVTEIGFQTFDGCSGLTSVTIPNSVTTIGHSAFGYCYGLTSVTIPNSVTKIGDYAFYFCSSLTSVTIGTSVTAIGPDAFAYCSGLTSVTIPNSVTKIGDRAFGNCGTLAGINVDSENPNFMSEDGIVYSKDKTSLLICPAGKKGEVSIPNSVTTIGHSAFGYCSGLTSVTIPNSVTEIGSLAFEDCSGLTSVTIPNSVTAIGSNAFADCSGLTSVTIPNSVTEIGYDAFYKCSSLKSVYCQWTEPIECYPSFPYEVRYYYAVLYVPTGCKGAYEKVDPWKSFLNIKEIDYAAGVEDVADGGVDVKVVDGSIVAEGCAEMEVYSMGGQLAYRGAGRAENLAPGVYVVRAGGKTVKVMVAR